MTFAEKSILYRFIISIMMIFVISSMASVFAQISEQSDKIISYEKRLNDLETKIKNLEDNSNKKNCNFFSLESCDVSNKISIWTNIIVTAVTASIIPISIWIMGNKFQKKSGSLFFDVSEKVFGLISGKENKERWEYVMNYSKYIKKHGIIMAIKTFPKYDEVYRLKENLNKLGALYKSKGINNKFLFETYGGIIVVLYRALKEDIEYNQKRNPDHCVLFVKMQSDADKYLAYKHPEKYELLDKMDLDKYW